MQPLAIGLAGVLRLDVNHRRVELALELVDAVLDAVEVGAEVSHRRRRRGRFLQFGLTEATELELLSMVGRSIDAVGRRRRPEGDEGLVAAAQLGVAEEPDSEPPLVLQLRVRHPGEPAGDRAEHLLNLV